MEKSNRRINPKVSKYMSISEWEFKYFFLLLRKGVYPYEDMDNWKKFNETTILPKEAFYSKLNLQGIMMQIMQTLKKYGKYLE